jgi:hypothetical protein
MIRYNLRLIGLIILLASLCGCVTNQVQPPPIEVTTSGPIFSSGDFECDEEPLPPAVGDPNKQGSTAGRYEKALRQTVRACKAQLWAIKSPLMAAGQVR